MRYYKQLDISSAFIWILLGCILFSGVVTVMQIFLVSGYDAGSNESSGIFWMILVLILWSVFLWGLLAQAPRLANLSEGMSFIGVFVLLLSIVFFVSILFQVNKGIYQFLGLMQNANQVKSYSIRPDFFDKNLTPEVLRQSLPEQKRAMSVQEIRDYFSKPILGYLAWNIGDTVVFCEKPEESKTILIDCMVGKDQENEEVKNEGEEQKKEQENGKAKKVLNLSKGLMIERKYLQMLP